MEERLAQLREEFAVGRRQIEALEVKKAELRETLLRIAGAIQILEEILSSRAPSTS